MARWKDLRIWCCELKSRLLNSGNDCIYLCRHFIFNFIQHFENSSISDGIPWHCQERQYKTKRPFNQRSNFKFKLNPFSFELILGRSQRNRTALVCSKLRCDRTIFLKTVAITIFVKFGTRSKHFYWHTHQGWGLLNRSSSYQNTGHILNSTFIFNRCRLRRHLSNMKVIWRN